MYLQATSLATVAKEEYAILLVSSLRYGLWGHIYYQSVLTKTKADFKTNATNSVAVGARPRALKTRSHDRTSQMLIFLRLSFATIIICQDVRDENSPNVI